MTVAAFLNSSHYYNTIAATYDVQDIIDELGTILKTTNSPVWTEPVAGTFKSPVDAFGRWFSVAVSRIDADTIQYVVKDQYDNTIRTSRMDLNADPGNEVKIYSGQYHLWIDSMRATPENFRSGLLDLSPQAQDAWNTVVYSAAYRTSDGTSGGESKRLSIAGQADSEVLVVTPNAQNYAFYTDPLGNNIYWPLFVRNHSTSQLVGRMYQVVLCPKSIAAGAEVTVPIDTGVTAKFRVAGATTSEAAQMTWYRYAVRAD